MVKVSMSMVDQTIKAIQSLGASQDPRNGNHYNQEGGNKTIKCYKCKEIGHIRRFCPKKNKGHQNQEN